MVYVNKLQRVLDYITLQNPEGWEQGVWAKRIEPHMVARLSPQQRAMLTMDPNICGSTACLAGTAVALEFGRDNLHWLPTGTIATTDASVLSEGDLIPSDFQGMTISEAAGIVLDLNYNQRELLFEGDNSLWKLWDIAAEITDGAIVRPGDAFIQDAIDRMVEGRDARDRLVSMLEELDDVRV